MDALGAFRHRPRARRQALFLLSGGDPDEEGIHLTRAAMPRERRAAVERFERFIEQKPDAAESVFAWQEAWRLLAGLPPSQIHFGCGCE